MPRYYKIDRTPSPEARRVESTELTEYTSYDSTSASRQLHDDDSIDLDKSAHNDTEEQLTLWAAARRWPNIVGFMLALMSTIVLSGYDSVVVGNVSAMPAFQEVFGEILPDGTGIIPSNWLSIWNVSSPLGAMAGALLAGYLSDIFGRKKILGLTTLLSWGAVALCLLSDTPASILGRRVFFFGAKLIQGLAIGGLTAVTLTYMSETVPSQLRPSILAGFPIFQLVGQIAASTVVQIQMDRTGAMAYRLLFLTQLPFGLIPMILAFWLPESPAWLLSKHRVSAARSAHNRLERSKLSPDTSTSFSTLQRNVSKQATATAATHTSYLDCFRPPSLRRTLLVMFANIIPELFGTHLLGNATYFLQMVGFAPKTANLFFITGIALSLFSATASIWITSRFGRRTLIVSALPPIALIWLAIAVIGTIGPASYVSQWSTSIGMMLVILLAGFGCWTSTFSVSSETPSLRLRARTQGIGWAFSSAVSTAFGFGMPYVYNRDAADWGAKSAYVAAGTAALAAGCAWGGLPEMRGRSTAEIEELFERRVPSRGWAGYRLEKVGGGEEGVGVV